MRWWIAGLLVVGGCPISREDFPAAKADAECDVQKRCQRGLYHVLWTGMDQCQLVTAQDIRVETNDLDWCAYDPREGRRCVDRVRHLECDEWGLGREEEACDLVFDCSQ